MGILLLGALGVFVVGFGIGLAILRVGGGLYRGSGSGARGVVGLLLVGCTVMTLVEVYALNHPAPSDKIGEVLLRMLLAAVSGVAGLGLLVSLLLSFRNRPSSGSLR
jgi:hypothetical protein